MLARLSTGNNIGKIILLMGGLLLIPLLVLPFYPSDARYWFSFAAPALFSIFLGLVICYFSNNEENSLALHGNIQRGSITVLTVWGYAFLVFAVPFVLGKQLSPFLSLYEALSGWTTTGLSVMDVTVVPKIFLFHRSFIQYCGGLGVVIVMIMFLKTKQSMNLYSAEGHPDQLTPNLPRTVRVIFTLYTALVLFGTLLYTLFGMPFFDSLNHAMCALSTAGFSTQLNSIGEYDSVSLRLITILLMLLGSTNFAILLLVLKGRMKKAFAASEIRFTAILLLGSIFLVTLSMVRETGMGLKDALGLAGFNVISASSTTGFSTMDFNDLTQFSTGIFILLMFMGGGAGSTAGGLKLLRAYLLIRMALLNLRRRLSPSRKIDAPSFTKASGKAALDSELIADTTGFFLLYLAIFVVGSLALCLSSGEPLLQAMFEFASSLGTVGISNGITSSSASVATLSIEMVGMIMGRLEIFIVLIGFYSFGKAIRHLIRRKESPTR